MNPTKNELQTTSNGVPERLDRRILQFILQQQQQQASDRLDVLHDQNATPSDDTVLLLIRHDPQERQGDDPLWKSCWDRGIAVCVTDLDLDTVMIDRREPKSSDGFAEPKKVCALALRLVAASSRVERNDDSHDRDDYYQPQIQRLVQECNSRWAQWQGISAWKGKPDVIPQLVSELEVSFPELAMPYSEDSTDFQRLALVVIVIANKDGTPPEKQENFLLKVAQHCVDHDVALLWFTNVVVWDNDRLLRYSLGGWNAASNDYYAIVCFPSQHPDQPEEYPVRLAAVLEELRESKQSYQNKFPQSSMFQGDTHSGATAEKEQPLTTAATTTAKPVEKRARDAPTELHDKTYNSTNLASQQQQQRQQHQQHQQQLECLPSSENDSQRCRGPVVDDETRLDRVLLKKFLNAEPSKLVFYRRDDPFPEQGGKKSMILVQHGSPRCQDYAKNRAQWYCCVTDLDLSPIFSVPDLEAVAYPDLSKSKSMKPVLQDCVFSSFLWQGYAGWVDKADEITTLVAQMRQRYPSLVRNLVVKPKPKPSVVLVCSPPLTRFDRHSFLQWTQNALACFERGILCLVIRHKSVERHEVLCLTPGNPNSLEYQRDRKLLLRLVEDSMRTYMARVPQCHFSGQNLIWIILEQQRFVGRPGEQQRIVNYERRLDLHLAKTFRSNQENLRFVMNNENAAVDHSSVLVLIRHGATGSDTLWKQLWEQRIPFCITDLDLPSLVEAAPPSDTGRILAVCLNLTGDNRSWFSSHIEPLAAVCFRSFVRWQGGLMAFPDNENLREQLLNKCRKYADLISDDVSADMKQFSLVLLVPPTSEKSNLYDIAYICIRESVPFLWIESNVGVAIHSTKKVSQVLCFPKACSNDEYQSDLNNLVQTIEYTARNYQQNHPQSEVWLTPEEINSIATRSDAASSEPAAKRRKILVEDDIPHSIHEDGNTVVDLTIDSSESGGDDENSSLDVQGDSGVDDELIRLEEEITLLQHMVDWIQARRSALDDELLHAQSKQKRLTHHVAELEQQNARLAEKQARQLHLQQQIDASIKLSETRLARLSASDVTVEEIERLAADQDVQQTLVNELQFQPVGVFEHAQAATVESKENGNSNNVVKESLNGKHINSLILAASRSVMKHQLEGYKVLQFSDLESLWRVRRNQACFASSVFLPCITSKELLNAILKVSAREILILDQSVDGHLGRHRREAMWCTCVDVRSLCRTSFIDEPRDGVSKSTIEEVTLKPVASAVEPKIDTLHSEPNNATSFDGLKPERYRIDPNVALCPYALSGVCADPDCVYQHLEEREKGAVLPRELVPLPNLCSRKATERRHPPASLGSRASGIVRRPASETGEDNLRDSSGFIALPNPGTDKDSSNDISSTSDDDCDGGFWWMRPERSPGLGFHRKDAPISEILAEMGLRFAHCSDQQYASMPFGGIPPMSLPGSCRAAGMMIDCVRVSVHSGRFDVARFLLTALMKRKEWLLSKPSSAEKESADTLHEIISLCSGMVRKTVQRCYAFGSQGSSPARVTADAQLLLASLFIVVKNLFLFLQKARRGTRSTSLQKWLNFMKELESGILFVPGDPPQDASFEGILKAYCSPELVHESEVEPSNPHLDLVLSFVDSLRTLMHLKSAVSEINSFRDMIDCVLYPTLNSVRNLLTSFHDNQSGALLDLELTKGAAVITYVVLGVIEWTASRLRGDADVDNFHAEVCDVCYVIDKILMEIRSSVSSIMMLDLLLAPAFASNVSLAITAKVYDRAHRRLESLLVDDDDAKLNMMQYSELLWSQLIQLHAVLPARILDLSEGEVLMNSLELPPAIVGSHEILSDFVSNREVLPHHVTLLNDWNLVAAAVTTKTKMKNAQTVSRLSHLRKLCTQVMTPPSRQTFQKVICLENQPLELCRIYGEPLKIRPTIPHSILLTGSTTLELNLCKTNLRRLPHHFGLYFPSLKTLRLFGNYLDELPETMHYLKDLEVLDVGNNDLAHLPSQFALPSLIVLNAGNNRLTQLPATVKGCKKLEYLELSGNPVGNEFWSLVAELPQLREIRPNKGQKTAMFP